MKVKQLIAELQKIDENLDVIFDDAEQGRIEIKTIKVGNKLQYETLNEDACLLDGDNL